MNTLFKLLAPCLLPAFLCAQERDHIVSVYEEKMSVPDFPGYVEEVVDATPYKPYIGQAQKGMGNKRRPARLENGSSESLLALFRRSFPDRSAGIPLVVRINHLTIYEVTQSNRETSFAEINVTFFKKEGDAYVECYEASAETERGGLDVTKKHGKNIADALEQCCRAFAARYAVGQCWNKPVAAAEVRAERTDFRHYPVFNGAPAQKGIWMSFNDFRDNKPFNDPQNDFSMKVKTKEKRDLISGEPDWAGPDTLQRKIWGLQWEGKTYIRVERKFYQLQQQGDTFFLYAPEMDSDGGFALVGGVFGGLSGALIGAAIDGARKGPSVRYTVDMNIGKLIPPSVNNRRKVEARTVFYASPFIGKNETLVLKIDGKEWCRLAAEEHARLQTGPDIKQFEVCALIGDKQDCQTVTPELLYTDLFLIRSKRGEPSIELLDGDHRAATLSNIRSAPEKARCAQKN